MFSNKRFAALFLSLLLAAATLPASAAAVAVAVDPQDCAKPAYPVRWQADSEGGNVIVAYQLNADGKVIESKVEQSSGDLRLDRASVRAVEHCKFKVKAGAPSWNKLRFAWVLE
jgi:protein TonB